MPELVHIAFWFHSALSLGFLGFALLGAQRAIAPSPVAAVGSRGMHWGEDDLSSLFYLAGGLYLAYAEIYLYRMAALASLQGS